MKEYRLAVIGAGSMGSAILKGVLAAGVMSPEQIWLSNPHQDKLTPFGDIGVHTTCSNAEAVTQSDIVILAVKPQRIEEVLDEIGSLLSGKCVVSIAAGISKRWLEARLPGAQVICVMPNTPLMLGCGACAMTERGDIPEALYATVRSVFACAGEVAEIPEKQMNRIIPVNGSSPAFFFRMAEEMVNAAADTGIDRDVALRLAAKTMEGAAKMLLESGKTAKALEQQVCSPGGTTLAALTAFDELDFSHLIREAFRRCTDRAEELGKRT